SRLFRPTVFRGVVSQQRLLHQRGERQKAHLSHQDVLDFSRQGNGLHVRATDVSLLRVSPLCKFLRTLCEGRSFCFQNAEQTQVSTSGELLLPHCQGSEVWVFRHSRLHPT